MGTWRHGEMRNKIEWSLNASDTVTVLGSLRLFWSPVLVGCINLTMLQVKFVVQMKKGHSDAMFGMREKWWPIKRFFFCFYVLPWLCPCPWMDPSCAGMLTIQGLYNHKRELNRVGKSFPKQFIIRSQTLNISGIINKRWFEYLILEVEYH